MINDDDDVDESKIGKKVRMVMLTTVDCFNVYTVYCILACDIC